MFHDQHLGPHENMLMHRLYNWKILERAPSYMNESIFKYTIKYSKMRGYDTEHVELNVLPQISNSTVLRITQSVRNGGRGVILDQMAALFRLGLGVPRLTTVAAYLETYSVEEDKDSSTIESICDLIEQHQAKLLDAYEDFPYTPYARYIDHAFNFEKVLDKRKHGTKVQKKKVPEGIPVVLIYQLKNAEGNKYSLVGGFRFTAQGFPVNFDHIICRPGFTAAPKTISSKSLRKHCNYVLVTGILNMVSKEYTMHHLSELGHHTEDVLLSEVDNVKNPELKQRQQELDSLNKQITKAKKLIQKYQGCVVPKSKRKLHRAAENFLATEDVRKYARQRERLDAALMRELQQSGPVTKCRFYALDLGLMKNFVDMQHVRAKLPKVEEVLKSYGFKLATEKSGPKEVRVHNKPKSTRVWAI